MDLNLKDKVVIVTGSTRGIGHAICDAFAREGAKTICTGTKQDSCDQVSQEFQDKYGVECIGKAVDVSSYESCDALITDVIKHFGRIDVLVNNAGITRDNLLLRMKPHDWQDVINTNLNSLYNCVKPCIRPMLKQRSGHIVNLSSIVGVIGNPGQSNYAASKAGMIGFTQSISKEFGAKGIVCNCIAPGFIETDMIKSLPKEYLDTIIKQVSVKRLGQTSEIADLAVFLGSDKSNYITGQTIIIDGGLN